ncbi:alpha/beta fold hydrolase [Streptomyces sp. NPDC005402]|uniref:alpha/beta fold hydrolase n=1 Tax=Streptomyces sp. NPDC005402 TaxID=3155338 RepID=UPI0033AF2A34
MWHQIAPILAQRHTVVLTDLRGYGGSAKPVVGADHTEYSKRAMVADQVAVMASFGLDTFAAVGHDRGARVVHRMCLDHPARVRRAAVLDIVPTRHVFPPRTPLRGSRLSPVCVIRPAMRLCSAARRCGARGRRARRAPPR